MTIYFDISDTSITPRTTGIQRVVRSVALSLAARNSDVRFVIFWADSFHVVPLPFTPPASAAPDDGKPKSPANFRRPWSKLAQFSSLHLPSLVNLAIKRYLRIHHKARRAFAMLASRHLHGADTKVAWSPGDTLLLFDPVWNAPATFFPALISLAQNGVTIIPCCYDLIPISHPEFFGAHLVRKFEDYYSRIISVCKRFLCISEYTKQQLLDFVSAHGGDPGGYRIAVFRLGVDSAALSQAVASSPAWAVPPRFILSVSTVEPRKNYPFLIDCFTAADIPEDIHLVIVGKFGWKNSATKEKILGSPNVSWHSTVTDAELAYLYERCLLVVFPSLIEGYGLPVLEGLHFGKLVLSSKAGPMPEIGAGLVEFFDPTDKPQLVRLLELFLNDPAQLSARERRVQDKFRPPTWDDSVTDILRSIPTAPS